MIMLNSLDFFGMSIWMLRMRTMGFIVKRFVDPIKLYVPKHKREFGNMISLLTHWNESNIAARMAKFHSIIFC